MYVSFKMIVQMANQNDRNVFKYVNKKILVKAAYTCFLLMYASFVFGALSLVEIKKGTNHSYKYFVYSITCPSTPPSI